MRMRKYVDLKALLMSFTPRSIMSATVYGHQQDEGLKALDHIT